MNILREWGFPVDVVERTIKITYQTAVVSIGTVGNVYTVFRAMRKPNKLPKSTNIFIISLSVGLFIQALNAIIDYVNHLKDEGDYYWGIAECDLWHFMNVYLPMMLALHCFFCLLDRFVLLAKPEVHHKIMHPYTVTVMLLISYVLPIPFTLPPFYFGFYGDSKYMAQRDGKECKFVTNIHYALISPFFTFFIPLAFDAFIIVKMFKTMEFQDQMAAILDDDSTQKLQKLQNEDESSKLPWRGQELRRQHRLAITMWSIYWNVSLFWIPQHVWQIIYKITEADWPRANNFIAWFGCMPCFIIPLLYNYYGVWEL